MNRGFDWCGVKVGRLTIKQRAGVHIFPSGASSPVWLAHCECGNSREVTSTTLRIATKNNTNIACTECPDGSLLDFIGTKVGSLTVAKYVGVHAYPNGNTSSLFLCECDCGNSKEFSFNSLRGAIRNDLNYSCGCQSQNKYEGTKIGWLTVISKHHDGTSYQCECKCGSLCTIETRNLSRAINTDARISCGCFYKGITVGQKFGKLTVLKKLKSQQRSSGKTRGLWECRCDCGATTIVTTDLLNSDSARSCGCSQYVREKAPQFSYIVKFCPNCKRDLRRDMFGEDASRPGGLKSLCRKCNYKTKDYSKVAVASLLRKKRTKIATPPWVNKDNLKKIYEKKFDLEAELGIQLHVDHIVPLNAENICGLNIPENLQITSVKFNTSKQNAVVITDDDDWIIEDNVRIHNSVFDH